MCMTARIALIALALGAIACNDDRTYVGDNGVYQVALSGATPPAYESADERMRCTSSSSASSCRFAVRPTPSCRI